MTPYTVGYLVGSLSQSSINRKVARALVRLAPPGLKLVEIPWGDLPIFNRDLEANFPEPAAAFKKAIVEVDAVLFVTPEYNRSIPGGLKNAIDWASRPVRQERDHAQTVGGDRRVAGPARHGHRPGAPAQHPAVLQFAAVTRRSLRAVHARPDCR